MAIPSNRLSSEPVLGDYLSPFDRAPVQLVDYETGGVAIEDASQGLLVQVWRLNYGGSPAQFIVTPESVGSPTSLFARDNVTDCSLAFDQLMRPVVAWTEVDGIIRLRWFDTIANQNVISEFGAGQTPRVLIDDPRAIQTIAGTSDVLLFYVRDGSLYYRQQRDRYETERFLTAFVDPAGVIRKYGRTTRNRIEFEVRTP